MKTTKLSGALALMLAGLILTSHVFADDKPYLAKAYGDVTYTINDEKTKHALASSEETTFVVGEKVCVASEKGVMEFKDLGNNYRTINPFNRCYTTEDIEEPSFLEKLSVLLTLHSPSFKPDGEEIKPGVKIRGGGAKQQQPKNEINETEKDKRPEGVYLTHKGDIEIVNTSWITSAKRLPFNLQMLDEQGAELLKQQSSTKNLSYFFIKAEALVDKKSVRLKVTNQYNSVLMNEWLQKIEDEGWVLMGKELLSEKGE